MFNPQIKLFEEDQKAWVPTRGAGDGGG